MAGFYQLTRDDAELFVRLTPRASREGIGGVETTVDGRSHLVVRVRAVPEKGAANAALERLVADVLGLPRRSVSVAGGATARLKTLRIAGDLSEIDARLQALATLGDRDKAG